MADTSVRVSGPFFDRVLRFKAMRRLRERILGALSQFAFDHVNATLAQSIRNPTPIYQTHIKIDDRQDDRWGVTDQGLVVYNHWLEGTGSRNFPVTRFRGYHAFSKALAATQARAKTIALKEVGQFVRTMGG